MIPAYVRNNLKPLAEVYAKLDAQCERDIAWYTSHKRQDTEEIKQNANNVRLALALLDASDVEYDLYASESFTRVDLGKFTNTPRDKQRRNRALTAVRAALGVPLLAGDKSVAHDAGYVCISLTPKGMGGVNIVYTTRLPRGAKCKIVKQTYRTIVCER